MLYSAPQSPPYPGISFREYQPAGPASRAVPTKVKLGYLLTQMDDGWLEFLLNRLTDGNDELSRFCSEKLEQMPEIMDVSLPWSTDVLPSEQPEQTPSSDMRMIMNSNTAEESMRGKQPIMSKTEFMLSELPPELRSQLLDFLNRRDANRFREAGNEGASGIDDSGIDDDSEVDQGRPSNPLESSTVEKRISMKAPKLFSDLGLTGWESKERRDIYRLATAMVLRELAQSGFDLETAWRNHSPQEKEDATRTLVSTLESVLGYFLPFACRIG